MLTLYDCSTAPSPRRARIALAEKGLTVRTVQVDLRSAEQLSPEFRRINPQCTVPALHTEEGAVLTDNAAIMAYLEARYPRPPLLGVSPFEKAQIASWNWRMEFEGLQAVAEALRNSSPAMVDRALPGPVNYAQIPALAQRGLARLANFFVMLDAQLERSAFVASDAFSVADITAVVAVDFARVVRTTPDAHLVHLHRWRAELASRASIAL